MCACNLRTPKAEELRTCMRPNEAVVDENKNYSKKRKNDFCVYIEALVRRWHRRTVQCTISPRWCLKFVSAHFIQWQNITKQEKCSSNKKNHNFVAFFFRLASDYSVSNGARFSIIILFHFAFSFLCVPFSIFSFNTFFLLETANTNSYEDKQNSVFIE